VYVTKIQIWKATDEYTWFKRTPEVVGAAATKVSGWPLRRVSGAGNGNEVGVAVVLPGRSCMTLMAGRVAPGWVADCANCTSSRCCILSSDGAEVAAGSVTTGDAATGKHSNSNDDSKTKYNVTLLTGWPTGRPYGTMKPLTAKC